MDDRRLRGQAESLMAASTPPLTLRRLDDVQLRLKDVIFKQTEAKARAASQEQMKDMLATFIERLAQMTASSTTYHERPWNAVADLIGKASSIQEIAPVLAEVMSATRAMALDTKLTHTERAAGLARTHRRQCRKSRRLQQELERQHPGAARPMTGTLNCKGLDEAMGSARLPAAPPGQPAVPGAARHRQLQEHQRPMGHTAGDAALVHLAQVTREVMRPQAPAGPLWRWKSLCCCCQTPM